MSHKLIITADDYGLCPEVNRAIEECIAAESIRSTCVMTNMDAYEDTAELRARFPHASIGIHWTLTFGRPVLPAKKVSSLVGPDGHFVRFAELRRRLLARAVDMGQLRAELTAQYVQFTHVAGQPDFWNTHQNAHVSPQIFAVCVDLALQLGIRAMRSHRRITAPRAMSPLAYNLRHPLYWLKGLLISRWITRAEARGALTPAGIVHSPGYLGGKADVEQIVRRVHWDRVDRTAELIIHPATSVVPELFGSLTQSRLREYATFRDPALRGHLSAAGVESVGFEVL
ncbi:ChbG/HpnK family deacetylase [Chloroflexales bacterium ZM16-3]|nr:ChbG/HpnK family deacetylase [Chloroflexales bacterium ZM16-3]